MDGQIELVNKFLDIYDVEPIIIKIIGQNFWPWQSLFTTIQCIHQLKQTPFFTNHNLHPKFDIQGVNKVVNPTTKDQPMWLIDV
jgi:hypothetical protein